MHAQAAYALAHPVFDPEHQMAPTPEVRERPGRHDQNGLLSQDAALGPAMSRAAPRIPRTVKTAKRKPNPRRAAQHLAFVRSLGICLACGHRGRMVAMHVRGRTDGGMGMKPADRYAVPGCQIPCHERQHRVGETTFWGEIGIDPLNVSLRLWTVSGDVEAGTRIIERARQAIELRQRAP